MSLGFKWEIFVVQSSVNEFKEARFKEPRGAAPF